MEAQTVRLSEAQFRRPFAEFWSEYFRKNPEVPCVRCIPPGSWSPRNGRPYNLRNVTIDTPIKQHALLHGEKSGFYDCVLVEQPAISAEKFREKAARRRMPVKEREAADLMERDFWKAVTQDPPLYGADTPVSFFRKTLPWGWNLRSLGCLLSQCCVPDIPGVTSPMTYFGMWKAFFSWHVEDVDLLSINFLHFGAPKVWYCVPPGKPRERFEALAASLFPDEARECKAFLRHKNVLITPALLHKEGIPFVKCQQNAGEFVVLNAGAYHCGFNQGFNCAEAVNFALPEWVPLGRAATRCCCKRMPDGVRLDMAAFGRPRRQRRNQEADPEEDEAGSSNESSSGEGSDAGSESDVFEAESTGSLEAGVGAESMDDFSGSEGSAADDEQEGGDWRQRLRSHSTQRRHTPSESQDSGRKRKAAASPSRVRRGLWEPASKRKQRADSKQPALQLPFGRSAAAKAGPKADAEGVCHGEPTLADITARRITRLAGRSAGSQPSGGTGSQGSDGRRPSQQAGRSQQHSDSGQGTSSGRRNSRKRPADRQEGGASGDEGGSGDDSEMDRADFLPGEEGRPHIILDHNPATGEKEFYMVQRVNEPPNNDGKVSVAWLKGPGADGLYRRSTEVWDELEDSLVPVRTQAVGTRVRLLTLRSKIMAVDID